jgi:Dyp-type peroxidase family
MAAPPDLDFTNIQGDILEGLPKKYQSFVFFTIADANLFRKGLKDIVPLITTTAQATADLAIIDQHKRQHGESLIKLVGTNIAFSHDGLTALNITDDLGDPDFTAGQLKAAPALGDPLTPGSTTDPAWEPAFKATIHGCFNITGESRQTINDRVSKLEATLKGAIKTVNRVDGAVRRGAEKGHEHFGFQDGVSEPAVTGFRLPNAGEATTEAGVILLGQPGDAKAKTRPAWAKDSSFLAFRKLRQFVPEFNDFVKKNPIPDPGLTHEQGSELLGARMVGRWKSGAPVERDPAADNLVDANDIDKINEFDYVTGDNPATPQLKCPFTAHLRKMNPRAGFPGLPAVQVRRITRQGIPYGPEVTSHEKQTNTTVQDRGLLFICYQSTLSFGFVFLQESWANNVDFPNKGDGLDPIIGQGPSRSTTGMDPEKPTATLALPKEPFVKPLGGVYMISPSIAALSGAPFSKPPAPTTAAATPGAQTPLVAPTSAAA